jgi:hypothetical protein
VVKLFYMLNELQRTPVSRKPFIHNRQQKFGVQKINLPSPFVKKVSNQQCRINLKEDYSTKGDTSFGSIVRSTYTGGQSTLS